MQAFYTKEDVYFDARTASLEAVKKCPEAAGPKRIVFGSDVSGKPRPS